MKNIDVGNEFFPVLVNRNEVQGDGKNHAISFRKKYLDILDNEEAWTNNKPVIKLDFSAVRKIGPSFANEAFGPFMQYASPDRFFEKVRFENISSVKMGIIKEELAAARRKK